MKHPKPDLASQERADAMLDVVRDVRMNARLMREWGLKDDATRAFLRARSYLKDVRRLRAGT